MTTTYELSEKDISRIIEQWAQQNLAVPQTGQVRIALYFDRPPNPSPTDPGRGVYAKVNVTEKDTPNAE